MFSCLMNMPRVCGGQAPVARVSSRTRKRSATSLSAQIWIHWFSGPSSVWPAAANGENLMRPLIRSAQRSTTYWVTPGCIVWVRISYRLPYCRGVNGGQNDAAMTIFLSISTMNS